jgi:predicted transcriptional regulator
MDKDIVKRAMELSKTGLHISQVAKQLGVSKAALRQELSKSENFEESENVNCVVTILHADESIAKTAYDTLYETLKALREKVQSPFVKVGELSSAASVVYRIYKEENADDKTNDENNPIARLFGDEIKQLKENNE